MVWQLPNPSRFLDDVVESLAASKHVIVMLPEPMMVSLPISLLTKRLASRGLGSLSEVSLSNSNQEDILDAIVEELGIDICEVPNVESFLDRSDLPSRYIAITGIEYGGISWMTSLSTILLKAGEHAQVSEQHNFNLIVLVSPQFSPPKDNVKLARHFWWGILSSVDIDCVTERSMVDYKPDSIAEHYWLRALCRGVAKCDPLLSQIIVETSPKSVDDLCDIIINLGSNEFPDIPLNCFRLPELQLGTDRIKPPRNGKMRELWSGGYLDWQDGSGLIFHPYVLAACGRRQEIERLVWKGQIQIILPVVEQARQTIIYWLTREYGEEWAIKLAGHLSEQDMSGLTSEIGPLCYFLFKSNSHIKRYNFGLMSNMAWKWRDIRNEISHGRPVSYDLMKDAYSLFEDVAKKEKLFFDFDDLI